MFKVAEIVQGDVIPIGLSCIKKSKIPEPCKTYFFCFNVWRVKGWGYDINVDEFIHATWNLRVNFALDFFSRSGFCFRFHYGRARVIAKK